MSDKANICTLIADSGATKTDWCLVSGGTTICRTHTLGLNPVHATMEDIHAVIEGSLMPRLPIGTVGRVYFYGSGCRGEWAEAMAKELRQDFAQADVVEVHGDLLGAARSLCGHEAGIACIIGTGSNSCLYDGERIADNIAPLGYILGDEGSGAVLGRMFLGALYKRRLPDALRREFESQMSMTIDDILSHVYREPQPSRFLASVAPFILQHMATDGVRDIVIDNFRSFFRHCVMPYAHPGLPIGIVGGLASAFEPSLREAAIVEGCAIAKIQSSPMDGLLQFHVEMQ